MSVDYNRDQGFLTGMGIDTKDKKKNGDEDKTGKYKDGTYTIVCNEAGNGAEDGGRSAMERCLTKNPDINVVYTINEPTAVGASAALKAQGKTATIVSIDGGCAGVNSVKSGVIGATAQQYPLKMAQLGMEAIYQIATGGAKPSTSPGLDFYDTGVALVTDKAATGVQSITSAEALEDLLGLTVTSTTTTGGARPSAAQAELSRRAQSPAQRIQHALHGNPWLSPLILLIVTIIVFTFVNPRFIQPNSLSLLVQQTAITAALALGQTLVILTAGIDLSVGAITILSAMIMASLAANNGVNGVLALIIGILFGLLAGWLNGLLVTRINLPPVHRHPGHAEHLHGHRAALLRRLEHPGQPAARRHQLGRPERQPRSGFRVTTGVLIVLRHVRRRRLRAEPDRAGAGTCTPSVTTRSRPASAASPASASCCRSTPWPASSSASPPGCSSAAPAGPPPTPSPTATSRASPPSSSAAPASSVAGAG